MATVAEAVGGAAEAVVVWAAGDLILMVLLANGASAAEAVSAEAGAGADGGVAGAGGTAGAAAVGGVTNGGGLTAGAGAAGLTPLAVDGRSLMVVVLTFFMALSTVDPASG